MDTSYNWVKTTGEVVDGKGHWMKNGMVICKLALESRFVVLKRTSNHIIDFLHLCSINPVYALTNHSCYTRYTCLVLSFLSIMMENVKTETGIRLQSSLMKEMIMK